MINFFLLLLLPIQFLCESIDMNVNDNVQESMIRLLARSTPDTQHTLFVAGPKTNHEKITSNERHNLQEEHHENRFRRSERRSAQDLLRASPLSWNYFRRYICGTGNQKCLYDER